MPSEKDKIFEFGSRDFLNADNPSMTAFICSTVYGYFGDNRLEVDANVTMSDCNDRINLEFSNYQWKNKNDDDYEGLYEDFQEKGQRMLDKYDLLIEELKKARSNYKKAYDKVSRKAEAKIRRDAKAK